MLLCGIKIFVFCGCDLFQILKMFVKFTMCCVINKKDGTVLLQSTSKMFKKVFVALVLYFFCNIFF